MISIFSLLKSVVKTLAVTVFFVHGVVWAGYEVGNGGDAVTCESQVMLLDLYESKAELTPQFPFVLDPFQRAHFILKSWGVVDGERVARWLRELQYMRNNIYWTSSEEDLHDIPDEGLVVLRAGCRLQQVAVQSRDPLTNKYQYHIDTALWNLFDLDSKTALLIHEVLYRDILDVHARAQSHLIRPFVRLVMGLDPQSMGFDQYVNLIKNIGFPHFYHRGWFVDLTKPFIIENGEFVRAAVRDDLTQECPWEMRYDSYSHSTVLHHGSLCRKGGEKEVVLPNGYTFKGEFSVVQYYDENLMLQAATSSSGVLEVFVGGRVVGGLNRALISMYNIFVDRDTKRTRMNVLTLDRVECNEILIGEWAQYVKCGPRYGMGNQLVLEF